MEINDCIIMYYDWETQKKINLTVPAHRDSNGHKTPRGILENFNFSGSRGEFIIYGGKGRWHGVKVNFKY